MSRDNVTTIIQLSTPNLVSAIHIIRISGKKAESFLRAHTTLKKIKPRHVYTTDFMDKGKSIDRVVLFYFKSPASYTGEDMAEIHCHGSLLVVKEILGAGLKAGLNLAGRGDFTRRAFLNGKLKLEQAEAVDVLIRSRSDYLKDNALRILENKASLKFADIKNEIIELIATLETAIEFPEEEADDMFHDNKQLYSSCLKMVTRIKGYLEKISNNFRKAELLEKGIKVAICGKTNTGKSTLMNSLLGADRALVSGTPGTTRDYISESTTIDGIPLRFYDTAGIRKTGNAIEKAGIQKTLAVMQKSDIVLFLITAKSDLTSLLTHRKSLEPKPILVFLNKCDARSKADTQVIARHYASHDISINGCVSLLSAKGAVPVKKAILRRAKSSIKLHSADPSLLNERQHSVIKKVIKKMDVLKKKLRGREHEEIIIEELTSINHLFDEINLSYNNEAVLDKIFSTFCIGK